MTLMHRCLFLAYLDPGTGSMVLQILVGGILGGAFFLKYQWKRIVRYFRRNKPDVDEPEGLEEVPPSDRGRQ